MKIKKKMASVLFHCAKFHCAKKHITESRWNRNELQEIEMVW